MAPRDVARVLAAGRIAIGVSLLAAPRFSLGMWIGRSAASPAVGSVGRALGAREVLLGAMALHTLDRPQVAARWLRMLAACDAVDLAATAAVRRELPGYGRALIGLMASAGAGGQLWAAQAIAAGGERDRAV
jgi:hypothetical protein